MRLGETYKSLDVDELRHCRTGAALASISQANAGLVRRDLLRTRDAREAMRRHTCAERIAICAEAGELFMHGDVPLDDGHMQSPQAYVEMLSATTGLPHTLCRRNMQKIFTVLSGMDAILAGLTRGLDLQVIDEGIGEQAGVPVSFMAEADHLAVVLPNNSPGVNSIWLPAVALKIPVLIKPGGEEPWTPWRIIQSLIVAGFPREGLGFYPTDHEGANTLLRAAGKAMIFGDDQTVQRYANDPCVQVHGPGRSKVIIGADEIERWRDYIDVLVASVADNSGRSCINASTIIVPSHADEIADALARRLANITPRPANDDEAALAGFNSPQMAAYIDEAIDEALREDGVVDVSARYRAGPRRAEYDGGYYLLPTVVRCESFDQPLANTEFMFPFVAVVQVDQELIVDTIGPSLAVTVISDDALLLEALMLYPGVDRLNIGAIPTSHVEWNQPHEGNLFDWLYKRRAIQRVPA